MSLQPGYESVNYPYIFLSGTTISFAYLFFTAVFRLYFHPLAAYPGPLWARLSDFPSYWHTLRKDRHIWLYQLQEEYGSTFRYRPDAVLFNTPSAFRHIYGPKGNTTKGDYYKVWLQNAKAICTGSAFDVSAHARKRRILNFAFSEKALRAAEPFIHSNIDRWLDLLGNGIPKNKEWSDSFDMAKSLNFLVFDILGDLCFGRCFDMKEPDSNFREIPDLMISYMSILHPLGYAPFSSFYFWLKPRGLDRLMEFVAPTAITNWQNFVGACLADRTQTEEELQTTPKPESEVRKDFFHWLFRAVDPVTGERGYDLHELFAESELLIIAGSDTTSVVMSAMLFYLVRNHDAKAKLEHEILSHFTYGEIKSGSKLSACTYMHAFITEAVRMCPPVAAELNRKVLPGGTEVDGHYIPEGLQCSTGTYCMSYNKDYFDQPFQFRPERWIVDKDDKSGASAEAVARAESAFCSFSTGARGCVGKNLAWLEMKLVLAKLICRFEIKGDLSNNSGGGDPYGRPGRRNAHQYQTYDVFVSGRHGPAVHLKKRV